MRAPVLWIVDSGFPSELQGLRLPGDAVCNVNQAPAVVGRQAFETTVVCGATSATLEQMRAIVPSGGRLIDFTPAAGSWAPPLVERAQACVSTSTAEELRRLIESAQSPSAGEEEPWRRFLIGESYAMQQVIEIIRLVACRKSTVLITGETGTGKELVARALHLESGRRDQPMVCLNCAAIPATLIEAELFGHTKGAFTGATANRAGRFEQAHRGTLFLDEIAELPLELQTKLLRVLQEREVQRLGSSETVKVDVRIIAAANVDLQQAVADRKFREDLYYRLNVVPVRLPPVRERKSDIPLLVGHFLKKICNEEQLEPKRIAADALAALQAYDWPGNVRQIEHVVEMAVALSGSRSVITTADFRLSKPTRLAAPSMVDVPDEGVNFEEVVSRLEASLLSQALAKTNGNKGRAADLLKLKRTTFLAKLKTCAGLLPNVVEDSDCEPDRALALGATH